MKGKLFFILISVWLVSASYGQDRYIVFFTDKNDSPYSINNPAAFLSERAIERRSNQGIAITEEDLPVNSSYVESVSSTGVEVFYTSKWFNGVLIQAEAAEVSNIESLTFVSEVEFVASGTRLINTGRTSKHEETEEAQNAFQNNTLGIDLLHEEGYFGDGILMAFMDSGFEGVDVQPGFEHLSTNNQILMIENFVRNNDDIYSNEYRDHGTRVLSTVAGRVEDEFMGSAPEADFMLFITEDLPTEFRIEEYNFLFAAEKADSAGVDIISTSLGYSDRFTDRSMDYVYEQMDGETTVITRAAEKAFEKGILIIKSAGNEGGSSTSPFITAPADGLNVISVGSVDQNGLRSSFSSIGPNAVNQVKPDLMAVGASTSVINASGSITTATGTSFTAPQVAGLAALLWQREPNLSNVELRELLLSLGNRFSDPDNEYGYGIPNFAKLVTSVDTGSSHLKIYPNPTNKQLTIESSRRITNIILINSLGQDVSFNKPKRNIQRTKLDLQTLASGIYVLQIEFANNTIEIRRISKSD